MKRLFLIYLVFACVFISCNHTKPNSVGDIDSIDLVDEICKLSDSSYLSHVETIVRTDNGYIFADYKTHKVSFLDKNFKFLNIIGSYGKGPGDLCGPIKVVALQDSLFVFEEMNQRISVFDGSAKFIRHINNVFGGSFGQNLAISQDGSELFCSPRGGGETPMMKVNLGSMEKTYFGKFMNPKIQGRSPIERYHFVLSGDFIISIAESDPVIKVFNSNTLEIVNEIRYDSIPIVNGTVEYIKDQRLSNPSPYISYTLVQDVSVYKNNLYLLVLGKYVASKSINHIVQFKIRSKDIQYERIIALNNNEERNWYSAFSSDEKGFLAFSNISGCLARFHKHGK